MEYKELLQSIKAKNYKPIYFLHGEESYFMDKITTLIEQTVLAEAEKSFNQTILYGKDCDHQAVTDTAKRYPMMAERQVVILKEAQDMKTLVQLQSYAEKPTPTTVLVIAHKHKKLDMRTAFAKAIQKNAVVFESKALYDNQIADWIKNYLKEAGYTIEAQAADLVAEYLGTDLSKVSNEMDKLMLNVRKDTPITPKHIQENIGISKDYNIFELQKAIGSKNILTANRIANYFAENPKSSPFVVTLSNLYGFFSKILMLHTVLSQSDDQQAKTLGLRSSFFLKDYRMAAKNFPYAKTEKIIALLHEYDLKSKGINSDSPDEGQLLKELLFKILH